MKRLLFAALLLTMVSAGFATAFAQGDEPTIYVVKRGDTLWGLSERFLQDPHYWPDLWARNQQRITNPHLIFPGQRVKVYPDRIEIEEVPPPPGETTKEAKEIKGPSEEVVQERSFSVKGGEGFLLEKDINPAGYIISTMHDRQIVGEDDIVYTDIGRQNGAKAGERYSIFRDMGAVSHPVTNVIIGRKVVPLGALQLSEMEEKTSKAIISKSYLEIGSGAYLMPYRERRREVFLKAADRDLTGYIVETQSGNLTIATGEIVYLDLGRSQGLKTGNLVYIVRDVSLDRKIFDFRPKEKLPVDVLGAAVVVELGENTSSALMVKGIDTIYRGDRVELRKSK